MVRINISDGVLTIDNVSYYSLNFEAFAQGNEFQVRNIYDKTMHLFKGKVHYNQLRINNITPTSAAHAVSLFNSLIIANIIFGQLLQDISEAVENISLNSNNLPSIKLSTDLLALIKSNSDSLPPIEANTDYPDVPISRQITPSITEAERVINVPCPGYFTATASDNNQGIIRIGASDVNSQSCGLEPGHSVPIEHNDLSEWYVLAESEGDIVYIGGSYKECQEPSGESYYGGEGIGEEFLEQYL